MKKIRVMWTLLALLSVGVIGSSLVSCGKATQDTVAVAPVDGGGSGGDAGDPVATPDSIVTRDRAVPLYGTAADRAWWAALTQTARGNAIVAAAVADVGKYVGLNCKEWARRAVLNGSRGVVNLPATMPNASGWYFGSSSYLVNVGSIRNVKPGDVVQVNWRLNSGAITPHTMIVESVSSTGFTVIESNWSAALTVGRRTITWTTFSAKVTAYTAYRIVG
ncbi:MAG: hypothetical protein U0704_12920 [Candidatus Eisenbacteria bacterium]